MSDGRKRLRWSDAEKLEICGQARVAGVSVAQVARRYALNANMLHAWMRDPRFSGGEEATIDAPSANKDVADQPPFYEVSVSSDPVPAQLETAVQERPLPTSFCGGTSQEGIQALRIDLALSDGRRVLIEGAMSLAAIVALVEGLAD